jgi:hypothetical protein
LETISLELERKRNQGCKPDAENIRTNFGHRGGSVCVLHRLAEGI